MAPLISSKKITLAGHQPHYLPWLGYIDKIRSVDIFCMIDTIPFEENLFQHRNKIRIAQSPGELFLVIPLLPPKNDELICNIKIDNSRDWQKEHWNSISSSYSKAPYFATYAPFFEEVYLRHWDFLLDINEFMIKRILQFFNIHTKLARASSVGIYPSQKNIHVALCEAFGATRYMSGKGTCNHLDEKALAQAGIEHIVQQFVHPTYPQVHGDFMPQMAAIDLLFNCGPQSNKYFVHE